MGPSVNLPFSRATEEKMSPRALDASRSRHALSKLSVGADAGGVNSINVLKLKPSSQQQTPAANTETEDNEEFEDEPNLRIPDNDFGMIGNIPTDSPWKDLNHQHRDSP